MSQRQEKSAPFAEKIALVTGSSRVIGRAIALRLARDGADGVIYYRRQPAAADTAAGIQALGRRALVVQGDLGDAAAVRQIFIRLRETFGTLDIFVAKSLTSPFDISHLLPPRP